jgi:hypothetical protein
MSDWRTHRNGLPRTGMYLERVARHRAAKSGYRVIRSRRRRGRDNNDSDYMLVARRARPSCWVLDTPQPSRRSSSSWNRRRWWTGRIAGLTDLSSGRLLVHGILDLLAAFPSNLCDLYWNGLY